MKSSVRILFIGLLIFLCSATSHQQGKWVIDYNSQLLIHGQSNVNKFTCFISCYNSTDTLHYDLDSKTKQLNFDKNKMIIPIFNFNCGNTMITKDFRHTVKAEKHPYLNIAFLSLEQSDDNNVAAGKLEITLGGVVKIVRVHFTLKPKGDFLQLTGNHAVRFSDFNLKAPQRMMGLVKVQEDLQVEFNLLIRPVVEG